MKAKCRTASWILYCISEDGGKKIRGKLLNRRDRYNLIPPIRLAKLTTVGPWVGDFVSSSFGSSPLLEYDELLCDLPLLDNDDDDAPYISNSLIAAVALVALFLDEFDDPMPTPTATAVTVIKASAAATCFFFRHDDDDGEEEGATLP